MFDFNLPRFLGETMGEFRGVGSHFEDEMIPIAFLISSLNSPVYVSVPVKDEKVVDKFLEDLDKVLATLARQKRGRRLVPVGSRLLPRAGRGPIAGLPLLQRAIGPGEVASVFARIDGGLYIASKKFILDDLAEAGGWPRKPATESAMLALPRMRWFACGRRTGTQRSRILGSVGPKEAARRA